ncbi:SWIM zinc finger family protein [Kitasatospora sp. NBC_01539]|uniref:SWIM zinc finger family protein n=1 Tax=Kitasatospora sp. NBC_01539 TaxID=2903577 RepID=UPI0038601905
MKRPTNRATKPDDGRTRIFPPLPPAPGRRSFAESWWGNAWVEALEGPQRSATGRLARGRTYARAGNVGEITVTPGRVSARVRGSCRTPYRTSMDLPRLTDRDWDLLLDAAAGRAGHIAALLDHDMPTALADDAARAGVRLLPRQGELTPDCSCPDWGHPCKHAAAVYYQVARLLDEDPFVLLLLRGRGEHELMDELQRRNAARAAAEDITPTGTPPAAPRGVPAREAFAAARSGIPPVPAPPAPVEQPGKAARFADTDGPAPGVDPSALEFLVTDTAARAALLLHHALLPLPGAGRSDADLTRTGSGVDEDLVRLAAAAPPPHVLARLADSGGRTPEGLTRAVRAWHHGGAPALHVLDGTWEPDPRQIAAARDTIKQAWEGERPPALRTTRNRLTVIARDAQLRLAIDGRWYPYRKQHGTWWPAGPADPDPATALATLLTLLPDPEP